MASYGRYSLPISKLRGVPQTVRVRLKARRITNCEQLIEAAGNADKRNKLSLSASLDLELLQVLVQRADMARVNGIGVVFSMMLEDLGIRDVQSLAAQSHADLHQRLRDYNQQQRLARRAPTPEEVEDWVTQAKALTPVIDYET